MATVKINRELLSDLVDDLEERHILSFAIDSCCERGPCPTSQRLERLVGTLRRDNNIED